MCSALGHNSSYFRVGPLCGRCEEHYTETFFSTKCKHDDKCTVKEWFWAVWGLYGLLYVLFFLIEKEIAMFMRMFGRWICCKKKSALTAEEEELHERRPGAYLTIFMYIVQVSVPCSLKRSIQITTYKGYVLVCTAC